MRDKLGNASLGKYWELAKLSAHVGLVQVGIQIMGFLTSILIIRTLSPAHYALYTLALTFLGMMSVLADGGIGAGVMSQSGKVWQDRGRLGVVLQTGLKLRKQFSLGALILVSPLFACMLRYHGADWTQIIGIELALLPLFYVQLSEGLLTMVPNLHQEVRAVQWINLRKFVLRFFLICVVLVTLPYTATIILATGIATTWSNWRMHRLSASLCELDREEDPAVRREILQIVKRSLPSAMFFCISGSLSIWLISFFGETKAIAEVGALNRIARIVFFITIIIRMVLVPRFSRLPEDRHLLLKRFFQVQGFACLVALGIVAGCFAVPDLILWLLGENYRALGFELKVQAVFIGVTFVGQSINSLASARGYILKPLPLITSQIIGQVIGILIFDCTTVAGVIMVSILPSVLLIVLRNWHICSEINKHHFSSE